MTVNSAVVVADTINIVATIFYHAER